MQNQVVFDYGRRARKRLPAQFRLTRAKPADKSTAHAERQQIRSVYWQLTDRIDELNQLTQNEVKKLYNKTIHHGQITEKGGAGLGLMKILRSSREPIKYTVTDIDSECSFIDLTISITDSAKQ